LPFAAQGKREWLCYLEHRKVQADLGLPVASFWRMVRATA
jgi:hypothetical protein